MSKAKLLSISVRVYQVLLFLYPVAHRREYGPLMVQMFRDLCRDTYRQGSVFNLVKLWVRTLGDAIVTAIIEHVTIGGSMNLNNRPVTPLPWGKIGLAVLPGLLAISVRSDLGRSVFGQDVSQFVYWNGLTVLCLLQIIGGFIGERQLAAWSFPALGLLLNTLPGVVIGLLLKPSSGPPSPAHTLVVNWVWPCVIWGAIIAVLVCQRHSLHMPKPGWGLLGLLVLTQPFLFWSGAILLLSIAVGLLLTRRNGLLAGLVVVAGEFWLVDEIFDPSYAMLIWSANYTAEMIVSVLPTVFFLVVAPIWVLRARSTWGRIWGLLLPPFIGLVSGEMICSVVFQGTPREYSLAMWLLRATGVMQFVLALALAAVIYHQVGNRDRIVVEGA
ncbi:MAG: hypothetical protein ACETWR_13045 [Anaerolineae bacterium]